MNAPAASSINPAGQPRPSRTARRLLTALILIQFFPVPPIMGIVGLAPENLIYLVTALYLLRRMMRMVSRDRRIMQLVLLVLGFGVLSVFNRLVHTGALVLPYELIRALVFILALAEVGAHEEMLQKLVRIFLFIAAFQIVFGLLIYVFGEPFAGIRNWMMWVETDGAIITRGSQLAGLYGAPHIFAYLLATFSVLCLAEFLRDRRWFWLGVMFLMLLGLFINAERSALGGLVVCSLLLVWKTSRKVSSVFVVVLMLFIVLGVQKVVSVLDVGTEQQHQAAYAHGTLGERLGETSAQEFFGRIGYSLKAAVSVLRHPLIGPSREQYVREVLSKDSAELVGSYEKESTLASHNHYVNIGVNAGVFGWVVGVFFLRTLWQMHRISVQRYAGDRTAYLRHCGITLALLAAMLNAFFHNAGIFSPELVTSCMVGLLIADYRLALRRAGRAGPSGDEANADGNAEGAGDAATDSRSVNRGGR